MLHIQKLFKNVTEKFSVPLLWLRILRSFSYTSYFMYSLLWLAKYSFYNNIQNLIQKCTFTKLTGCSPIWPQWMVQGDKFSEHASVNLSAKYNRWSRKVSHLCCLRTRQGMNAWKGTGGRSVRHSGIHHSVNTLNDLKIWVTEFALGARKDLPSYRTASDIDCVTGSLASGISGLSWQSTFTYWIATYQYHRFYPELIYIFVCKISHAKTWLNSCPLRKIISELQKNNGFEPCAVPYSCPSAYDNYE